MKVALTPGLQRFVEEQVERGRFEDADDLLRTAVRRLAEDEAIRAALGSAAHPDVADVAYGVLSRAVAGADEDIRMILAEVSAITAAKAKMRELLQRVGRDVSSNLGAPRSDGSLTFGPDGMGGESAYHRVPMPVPDPVADGSVVFVVTDLHRGPIDSVDALTGIQTDLKGKLDGMNEMSEMTSLRLQMMMDRRSKFISTLSNIMKKIAATQDTLVQNLK